MCMSIPLREVILAEIQLSLAIGNHSAHAPEHAVPFRGEIGRSVGLDPARNQSSQSLDPFRILKREACRRWAVEIDDCDNFTLAGNRDNQL